MNGETDELIDQSDRSIDQSVNDRWVFPRTVPLRGIINVGSGHHNDFIIEHTTAINDVDVNVFEWCLG